MYVQTLIGKPCYMQKTHLYHCYLYVYMYVQALTAQTKGEAL